jgi:GAF domain-containing protein
MAEPPARFNEVLAPLLDLLGHPRPQLEELATQLDRAVKAAPAVLAVDGVGLMLADGAGEVRVVGFSDELVAQVERAQAAVKVGPGPESLRIGESVAVQDINDEPHYGALRELLVPTDMRAVLSCPIFVGKTVIGHLNAAMRDPHEWTPTQIRAAELYAQVIGLALSATARGEALGSALPGAASRGLAGSLDGSRDAS